MTARFLLDSTIREVEMPTLTDWIGGICLVAILAGLMFLPVVFGG